MKDEMHASERRVSDDASGQSVAYFESARRPLRRKATFEHGARQTENPRIMSKPLIFTVSAAWDEEASVWTGHCDDIPAAADAPTLDGLASNVRKSGNRFSVRHCAR
jgi:hypothetical protein